MHPVDFFDHRKVKEILVECEGDLELGEVAGLVSDAEGVEVFKREIGELRKVERRQKVKYFDRDIIEVFEVSKHNEADASLQIKIFKEAQRSCMSTGYKEKWTGDWINVAVGLDDSIWDLYYKVFVHLFGISNYADVQLESRDEEVVNNLNQVFLSLFTSKDKPVPFKLELAHPSYSTWCPL